MSADHSNAPHLLVHGLSYRIVKRIGEGAFSVVYLVVDDRTGARYAVKRATVANADLQKAHDELALIDRIGHHRNLVHYEGSEVSRVSGQCSVSHVMEYCSMSVIADMLKCQEKRIQFSPEHVLNIVTNVVAGIQHLHALPCPVTHRDIKPENILRTENGRYVLCDYGSATSTAFRCITKKELSMATEDIERNTTMMYRAPEMIELWRKQLVNQKTDVWALGVLMYYLMYFRFPFEETAVAIVNAKVSFPQQPYYPDAMQHVVRLCLTPDPMQRPSVFEVACIMCSYDELGVDPEVLSPMADPGYEQEVYMSPDHPVAPPVPTEEPDVVPPPTTVSPSSIPQQQHPSGAAAVAAGTSPSSGGGAGLFGMLDWGSDVAPPPPAATTNNNSSAGGTTTTTSRTTVQHVAPTKPTNSGFEDLFGSLTATSGSSSATGSPQSFTAPSVPLPVVAPTAGTTTTTTVVDLFSPPTTNSSSLHTARPGESPTQYTTTVTTSTSGASAGTNGDLVDLFSSTPTMAGRSNVSPVLGTSVAVSSAPDLFAGGGFSGGSPATTGGPSFEVSSHNGATTTPQYSSGGLDAILSGFEQSKFGSTNGAAPRGGRR